MKKVFKLLINNWLLVVMCIILILVVIYVNYKNYINLSETKKTEIEQNPFPTWP